MTSAAPASVGLGGRYAIRDPIGSGGMATVHLGRLHGDAGFGRIVAIKRLHPQFASDPEFVQMFTDEARLAARIAHPNVVPTLDVVSSDGELFMVMEYVHGESLQRLMKTVASAKEKPPTEIVASIVCGMLQGLHAAHEAKSELGEPLNLVHRDVSPHNVLVGVDGVARLLDFGVAKAVSQLHTTREGQLKGKLAYMAPEQVREGIADRQTDVFSASVMLWQVLTGRRLFAAKNEGELVYLLMEAPIEPPSKHGAAVGGELDAAILKGLSRDRSQRYATAHEMLEAIEEATPIATQRQVGKWVQRVAAETLAARKQLMQSIELELSSHSARPPRASMVSVAREDESSVDVPITMDEPDAATLVTPPTGPNVSGEIADVTSVREVPSSPRHSEPGAPAAALPNSAATPPQLLAGGDADTGISGLSAATNPFRKRSNLPLLIGAAALGVLALGGAAVALSGGETKDDPAPEPSVPAAEPAAANRPDEDRSEAQADAVESAAVVSADDLPTEASAEPSARAAPAPKPAAPTPRRWVPPPKKPRGSSLYQRE